MTTKKGDIIIVGAGIVGASAAMQLQQAYPGKRILLIEKENQPAQHQTGRNSGVIHAGVYYQPGSLKARFCKQGLEDTVAFCQRNDIAFEQCGKLIVATDALEHTRLEALFQRCQQNELSPQWLDADTLIEAEPNIRGLAAVKIQQTGITDYQAITSRMLEIFTQQGGEAIFGQGVRQISERKDGVTVLTDSQQYQADFLVNCAGLQADRLIEMMQLDKDFKIIPFRGEYYRLAERHNDLINHLIYPVPDPGLPFLGVHLTKMIDGSVTAGPNAVLALAKEGYRKGQFSVQDMARTLTFSGSWRVFAKHWRSGLMELQNSVFKAAYLKRLHKYCPQLTSEDLLPYPSGIRAQAVDRQGNLLHDFVFVHSPRSLHVGNAPSPAATSALPIGQHLVAMLQQRLND